MNIQLSDHFTLKKLLRFTFPSVIMMIFTSIYGVVDGIFVSNFVGTTPFAALNLIMPVCMLLGGVGFMIGTGGSALVARLLGEGNREKANRVFSMLIWVSVGFGVVLTVLGVIFVRPIAALLGAEGEMLDHCVTYGRILILGTTAFILQNEFQSFLVTAEKPQFGLAITLIAGVTNIILDALFVAWFRWGLVGAAVATISSQFVGGCIPLLYFLFSKNSILKLGNLHFDGRSFLKACTNGSSEMMTNLSMSIVNILYNFQLMRLIGENGVAAYGVIMYVSFFFVSLFIGFSIGCAPIISFHFGAQNHAELKNLRKLSTTLVLCASLMLCVFAFFISPTLSKIFVGYDADLFILTRHAFRLYAISYLFVGWNIFGSAFFTALNNGAVSALLSFVRTLALQVLSVLLLPLVLDLDGVWLSVVVAEGLAAVLTLSMIIIYRKRYRY